MEIAKFTELEEKIRDIIDDYATVKKKTQEMEAMLKSKEGELEEARGRIARLQEERDSVRIKVDSLLEMLQNIQL